MIITVRSGAGAAHGGRGLGRSPAVRLIFMVYENWESGADLDAHLTAPHLTQFAGRIPELLDADGLTVRRVQRIA